MKKRTTKHIFKRYGITTVIWNKPRPKQRCSIDQVSNARDLILNEHETA